MSIMTLEEAKAIQEAFGPCTPLYECYDAEYLIDMYPGKTARQVAIAELKAEDTSIH